MTFKIYTDKKYDNIPNIPQSTNHYQPNHYQPNHTVSQIQSSDSNNFLSGTGFFYATNSNLYFVTSAQFVIKNNTGKGPGDFRDSICVLNGSKKWINIKNDDIVYDNMSDIALIRLDKYDFKEAKSATICTEIEYNRIKDNSECFSYDNNKVEKGTIKNKKYYDPTSKTMICESISTSLISAAKGPVFRSEKPVIIGMISYYIPFNDVKISGVIRTAGPNCIEMMKCIKLLIDQLDVKDNKSTEDKKDFSMNIKSNYIGLKCGVAFASELKPYNESNNGGIIVDSSISSTVSSDSLGSFKVGDLLLGFEYTDNNGKINNYEFGTSEGQVMPGIFLYKDTNITYTIKYKEIMSPDMKQKNIKLTNYGRHNKDKNCYKYNYLSGSI